MDQIGRHVKKLGGMQGAHWVRDVRENSLIIKPTKREGQLGAKETISEYIAGRLAEELGLNVPKHGIAILPQEVVDTYPELSKFEAGYVMTVQYLDGVDLTHTEFFSVKSALTGLSEYTNRKTAIGIIVTDSWLLNDYALKVHRFGSD